jgi:excisionase family DNA binding protein
VPDLSFTDAGFARLVDEVAERVEARVGARSPWLDAPEAAEYLRCKLSRVRKLTATGELPAHHDGRRVLYRRDELDAFVLAGGAASP